MLKWCEITRLWKREPYVRVRHEVLKAVTINNTIFWNITPCSLVEICLKMKAPRFLRNAGELYKVTPITSKNTAFLPLTRFMIVPNANIFGECDEHPDSVTHSFQHFSTYP
jgi:hypothetical protein